MTLTFGGAAIGDSNHLQSLYTKKLDEGLSKRTVQHMHAVIRRSLNQALRHTAATLLLKEKVHPKIVQEMLGHSTISLTLDTYSHILPDIQQEAADKMDKIFGEV